jgi:2-methylaconitate cis-trans-isomerase PrpF
LVSLPATLIEGSVAAKIVAGRPKERFTNIIDIEHPSGKISVSLLRDGNNIENTRAAVIRTTRKLFEGVVCVPEKMLSEVD